MASLLLSSPDYPGWLYTLLIMSMVIAIVGLGWVLALWIPIYLQYLRWFFHRPHDQVERTAIDARARRAGRISILLALAMGVPGIITLYFQIRHGLELTKDAGQWSASTPSPSTPTP